MTSCPILLRMTDVSDRSFREIKTHILCLRNLLPQIVPFCKIMLRITVEQDRPQMTILWNRTGHRWQNCGTGQATDGNIMWRMSVAWWIRKATGMHSEYVILFNFSKATMVRRTRLIVRLYVHCLYCWIKICNFSWWLASRSKETLALSYQSARRSRIPSNSNRRTRISEKDIMFVAN
jgi:hypothetical protein